MGAQLVQFPFAVAGAKLPRAAVPSGQDTLGYGAHYRRYEMADGHAFLACRPEDLNDTAGLLGAVGGDDAALASALAGLTIGEAVVRLKPMVNASLVPIRRLDELRAASTLDSAVDFDKSRMSFALVRTPHPSGHRVTLPLPSWYRSPILPIAPLSPAPAPGSHSRQVLAELGIPDAEQQQLLAQGVVAERWHVMQHYLPR